MEKHFQFARQFWKYGIWPLALLLVCIMVASVVYFLIAGQNLSSSPPSSTLSHDQYYKNSANSREPNAINFSNNYNNLNRNQRPNETSRRNETAQIFRPNVPDIKQSAQEDYPHFRAPTTVTSSPSNKIISSTTVRTVSAKSPAAKILLPIATTTIPSFKSLKTETSTVKNVKVYTNSNSRRKLPQPAPKHTTLLLPTADELEENAVERSKLLFPSKETFENFGFTSGHQNSFGIPIEEDERVLRMLNHQMLSSQPKLNESEEYLLLSITTDANIHQTKVSPTLPNIKKNFATTERIRPVNVTTDDGNF